MKKVAEMIWLLLSITLVVIGARSFVLERYQSWLQLPWSTKHQPLELEIERLVYRFFPPEPNPEAYAHINDFVLEQSMLSGANWLVSVQEPSGRFKYWYDPNQDRFSSQGDDNFHRQAGAGFSLALVYEMTQNERYLAAAKLNIHYLLRYKRTLAPDKAYFFSHEKADLGAASLPMFTMLKLRQLTGSTAYDEDLRQLANFIIFLQEKYQTGQFKSTYVYEGDYEFEKRLGWESKIYPGEAMLALAWMYQSFKNPRYKESLDWALGFYSAEEYWKHHAFLPWTISAFVSLYMQTGESKYADYVLRLTDHLLTQQNLDSGDEVYGSFHAFPSVNTASYLEGLGDAIQLVQEIGDSRREKLYVERAKMGYRWLLLLQYNLDNAKNAKSLERALGGFRHSLTDSRIRIDNTQHAISSLTKGLRFIFGRSTVVPEKWPELEEMATF